MTLESRDLKEVKELAMCPKKNVPGGEQSKSPHPRDRNMYGKQP